MKTRNFIKTTIISLPVLAVATSSVWAEKTTRPNIVWMFADDHAYQAIGTYGGRFKNDNLTPNIDTIARDGMVFYRCYVANSICAPSRATLLTGKHSHLNGKKDNRGGFNHDQQQFQKILLQHGYQTAMIGKIHLNGKMQGFDYWEVLPGQGRYWNPEFITEKGKTNYPNQHSTDVITDRALNWLKNGRDINKPFMLMVHFKAPHRNWQPTTRWKEKFKDRTWPEPETLFDDFEDRGTAAHKQDMSIAKTMKMEIDLKANQPERQEELSKIDPNDSKALVRLKYQWYMRDYLACVAGVDENVGRLLAYLKDSGLDKNTVVMYSSDQGFYLGEHGWFDKRFMYEESFRTPLLVRWPSVVKPGTRNDDLVQNIDWAETFLDIAGAPIPDDMQGRSLVPLLKGRTPDNWRASLYYHYYEYPAVHSVRRHEGVGTKRYKLIRFYGKDVPNGEEWEFYDLVQDPNEMKSIYDDSSQKDRITEMKKELQRLRDFYGVPEDQKRDAFYWNSLAGSGVNLGNALEAPEEGKWGVRLEEKYFDLIAGAGFKSVRIPVRWSVHADTIPPYTIDKEFLARVDWTIEQALSRKLVAIVNIHHYKELVASPDKHKERFLNLWKQISEHYSDHPPTLYFEILNEPCKQLTNDLWNEYLGEAIRLVRKSNPSRAVIVGPTQFNSISQLKNLKLPQGDKNIIVTFHYYQPSHFTHQGAEWLGEQSNAWLGTEWTATEKEKNEIISHLDQAVRWAKENGVPLFMGEFGAYNKADMASRSRWTTFLRSEVERRDISWAYWEFCAGFGIYDPVEKKWRKELLNSLLPESRTD